MKGSDMIDSPARRALLGLGLAGGLSGLGMARALAADRPPGSDMRFASSRPPPGQRRFVSPAVDAAIADLQRRIGDPELAWMFDNCLPNTLDTTVTEGTVDVLRHGLAWLGGDFRDGPSEEIVRGKTITLESAAPINLEYDGELGEMASPARFGLGTSATDFIATA